MWEIGRWVENYSDQPRPQVTDKGMPSRPCPGQPGWAGTTKVQEAQQLLGVADRNAP